MLEHWTRLITRDSSGMYKNTWSTCCALSLSDWQVGNGTWTSACNKDNRCLDRSRPLPPPHHYRTCSGLLLKSSQNGSHLIKTMCSWHFGAISLLQEYYKLKKYQALEADFLCLSMVSFSVFTLRDMKYACIWYLSDDLYKYLHQRQEDPFLELTCFYQSFDLFRGFSI